jgi:hypothetical protein
MFWVEIGVENRPKKESFGVDFTSRGKHIPKQEDMFGCHVLGSIPVCVGENKKIKK